MVAPCGTVAKEELDGATAPPPSLMVGITLLFLKTTFLMHIMKVAR